KSFSFRELSPRNARQATPGDRAEKKYLGGRFLVPSRTEGGAGRTCTGGNTGTSGMIDASTGPGSSVLGWVLREVPLPPSLACAGARVRLQYPLPPFWGSETPLTRPERGTSRG